MDESTLQVMGMESFRLVKFGLSTTICKMTNIYNITRTAKEDGSLNSARSISDGPDFNSQRNTLAEIFNLPTCHDREMAPSMSTSSSPAISTHNLIDGWTRQSLCTKCLKGHRETPVRLIHIAEHISVSRDTALDQSKSGSC